MFGVFKKQKKEVLINLERKLHLLVDRKEKKMQSMDEHGRNIVMELGDYVGNFAGQKAQRAVIAKAQRYLKDNRQYY